MLFNSIDFLIFFPIVLVVYYLLPGRGQWIWLLGASLAAYGYYQPVFLAQLLAAIAVAYGCALWIHAASDKQRKRRILTGGIPLLTANLFAFKYTSFLNESLRAMFGWLAISYPIPSFELILPIGISFYTLQVIGYLVDVYRGAAPERHLGHFSLFVAFFPKMISGPIERANNLLPQLKFVKKLQAAEIAGGLKLIAWGAFKKVVVADRLAPFVDQVYGNPSDYNGVATVFATVLFAFQIYCDFSGYTDMALGVARTFGYRLAINFNRPYLATSIQDFWKRWHISLTSWLTDYVYTPLTRNKIIKIKWYTLMLASLFATFLLSGLWHGAEWTFVAWGALHGSYLVFSALTQKWRGRAIARIGLNRRPTLLRAIRVSCTFSLVCLAYILFNASTLSDAIYMVTNLGTGWGDPIAGVWSVVRGTVPGFLIGMYGVALVICVEAVQTSPDIGAFLAARPQSLRWSFYYVVAVSIVILGAFYDTNPRFIYFQF